MTSSRPKSKVVKTEFEKFIPSKSQQELIDQYGKQDGRDIKRLQEAIDLAAKLNISWRKAFFMILGAKS